MRSVPAEERFWPRVDKSGDCWLWTGPLFDGYGRIKIGGQLNYVHRLSYEWIHGPVADGLQVDHKCRVRHCVNPDHMQAVPKTLNAQNLSRIGRGVSGARGVTWQASHKAWRVRVGTGSTGCRVEGGYFRNLEDAVAAATALRNQIMTNNLEDRRPA